MFFGLSFTQKGVIMTKRYSIKDIARLSGVSVATVSRVINNNGRFSEVTKNKVLKVIEDTGYQMNFSAKSLRMNKSFSVGILVPDISNYFFADTVQKIEEILFEKGYSTIICNTSRNISKENAYIKMLEGQNIDGLIVISGADEFGFDYLEPNKKIPYICIDREPKFKEHTIYISSNHYQGSFEATESLLNSGVKTPMILMHKRKSPSSIERLNGFKDALKKNNIIFNHSTNLLKVDYDTSDLEAQIENHFNKYPMIDGIFAINDEIGIKALSTFDKLNLKVPEQIKIIGFDNIPSCDFTTPSLSSVNQDTTSIAENAVNSLLNLINEDAETGETILIPVSLILRQSSK